MRTSLLLLTFKLIGSIPARNSPFVGSGLADGGQSDSKANLSVLHIRELRSAAGPAYTDVTGGAINGTDLNRFCGISSLRGFVKSMGTILLLIGSSTATEENLKGCGSVVTFCCGGGLPNGIGRRCG